MSKKNKQTINEENPMDFDMLFDSNNTVSSTECTGLIPTPPLNDEEAESYTDIYAIPQPENKKGNGLQHE